MELGKNIFIKYRMSISNVNERMGRRESDKFPLYTNDEIRVSDFSFKVIYYI